MIFYTPYCKKCSLVKYLKNLESPFIKFFYEFFLLYFLTSGIGSQKYPHLSSEKVSILICFLMYTSCEHRSSHAITKKKCNKILYSYFELYSWGAILLFIE